MTQRVARPMKFAAFISIIISVAVLFVACQGAVGPAGKDGKDGVDGTQGESIVGPPGAAALYKTFDGAVLPVYLNNGETADSAGEPETVDLSTLFAGGLGDITIGDISAPIAADGTDVEAAQQIFAVSEEDGVVTFAVRMDEATPPMPAVTASQYVVNMYTVTIEDSTGPDLDITLSVRRNQPPGDITLTAFTLGTDSDELDTARAVGNVSCATQQECTLTVAGTDPDTSNATDELSYAATFESDAFEVVRTEGNMILFRGLKTTDDGDATTADDSVEVTITITDLGGLENETTVDVQVDEAPNGSIPDQTIKYSAGAQVLITNLDSFFSDPDGPDADLTYTVKDGVVDATKATVTVDSGANPPTLSVTPAVASGGTTSVTIVAMEAAGLTQKGEATFSLTINP